MNRTVFLIDGFNLYHSVRNASADLGLKGQQTRWLKSSRPRGRNGACALKGQQTRWLNIYSMCSSYLSAIGNNAQIAGVFYFSALARHIEAFKPDVVARHKLFIECLESTGISVELARFKKKSIPCDHCGLKIKRYEEKETDVAVAAKLLELLFLDECDTAVLVTGDTDIVPAVKTAQRLFPKKQIAFLLPYKRHNQELVRLVAMHFEIKKETYVRHQFADPYLTSKGKTLHKPSGW